MSRPITSADIAGWFTRLETTVVEQQDVLDQLDAGAGDGDHGATMVMGLRRVVQALTPLDTAQSSPQELLKTAGRAFAGVGGSIGPLWGLALLRASQAVDGVTVLDGEALSAALTAAAAGMQEIGGARAGDRTLLDALIPARDAFTAMRGRDLQRAAAAGLAGSYAGARETATMPAKRGRAARNPTLAAGRVDAGAASIALAWTCAVPSAQLIEWRVAVSESVRI